MTSRVRPDLYDFQGKKFVFDGFYNFEFKPLLFRSRQVDPISGQIQEEVDWEKRRQVFKKSLYSIAYQQHQKILNGKKYDFKNNRGFDSRLMKSPCFELLMKNIPGVCESIVDKVKSTRSRFSEKLKKNKITKFEEKEVLVNRKLYNGKENAIQGAQGQQRSYSSGSKQGKFENLNEKILDQVNIFI